MSGNLRSELLMPAGSLFKLKMSLLYGADAVYLGTPDMSLRTKSEFTLEQVVEGIEFAHKYGKRVYLTLNMFAHNKDIPKLDEYIETVRKVKPDGLIIADPGVFQYVKEKAPELELHVSTQANICSWLSVKFWEEHGAKLVVLAREVTFEELTEIRHKCPDIKLEAFVHGSMCMTYSGRCMLSNYLVERGANQGNCANSCRWKYKVHMKMKDGTLKELNLTEENLEMFEFFLEEEHRAGELMQIEEDERGSYILNAKDLCLMPKLDQYLELGIDSLKVEGRGRSAYYAALVARAYRIAMDDWARDPENWSPTKYMQELETIPNRGYSLAFHEGRLTNLAHNFEATRTFAEWEYAGHIESVTEDAFLIEIKNRVLSGDVLEFVSPFSEKVILLRIYEFENTKNGKITDVINAGQKPIIRIPFTAFEHESIDELKRLLPEMTVIRKEAPLTQAEWDRVKLDRESINIESGNIRGSYASYEKKLEKLQKSMDANENFKRPKTPRLGVEGCCGKGCNGCMVFWHDDSYAKARELLKTKKQGEMFERNMIEVVEEEEDDNRKRGAATA